MVGCFHKGSPSLASAPQGAGRPHVGQRRVTHREAKHSRFTRGVSAGENTAHTYRGPRADTTGTTNTKAEVRVWKWLWGILLKIQGQLWCSEIQTENCTKPTHKYIYILYVCFIYIYIKFQNKSPRNSSSVCTSVAQKVLAQRKANCLWGGCMTWGLASQ